VLRQVVLRSGSQLPSRLEPRQRDRPMERYCTPTFSSGFGSHGQGGPRG
jgi:hypothetical protein